MNGLRSGRSPFPPLDISAWRVLPILAAALLLLVACAGDGLAPATAPTGAVATSAVLTPIATTEAPTPLATSGPEEIPIPVIPIDLDYRGVHLTFPSTFAAEVDWGAQAAATPGPGTPEATAAPTCDWFLFYFYYPSKRAWLPVVRICPAGEYRWLNAQAGRVIDALQQTLAGMTTLVDGEMPFLPLTGKKQLFHSNVKLLSFQNGRGIRYLTQYGEGTVPINNYDVIYTFQGMTNDARYYLSATFPVENPALAGDSRAIPGGDASAFARNYPEYLRKTVAALEAMPPDHFKASLTTIDSVIESFDVGPAALTPAPTPAAPTIIFHPGQKTAAHEAVVDRTARWVVHAAAGERLRVEVTPIGVFELTVSAASGGAIPDQDPAPNKFAGTVPSTGDYFLDIHNTVGGRAFYIIMVTLGE